MRYLADILTAMRLLCALALCACAAVGGAPELAFMLFVLGELTDAFDGTAAAKWPFPKNKIPKYRRYAAKYDMFIDAFLGIAMAIYFTARISLIAGLIICGGFCALAVIIDFVVYGKLMGHPDDCRDHSLIRHHFPLAKKIILARRMLYLTLMVVVAAWTLYVSGWDISAKITITVVAAVISLFLWFFLSQRRHHISRDAVDIERKLTRESRK